MSDLYSHSNTGRYNRIEKENAHMNSNVPPNLVRKTGNSNPPLDPSRVSTCTLDFDCQGAFRVATIGTQHDKNNKLQKFFSPLRVPDHMRVLKKKSTNINDIENDKGVKRSRDDQDVTFDKILGSIDAMKKKKMKQEKAEELIANIQYMRVESDKIYDRCPAVAEKIKAFLAREGVERSSFLRAIDVHGNSLNAFLNGKDQEQCSNKTYKPAYLFFEKLRILEGRPKSRARLLNEQSFPDGFPNGKKRAKDKKKESISIDSLPVSLSEFC